MAELTVTKLHLMMMMICKIKQGLFFCMSSIAPGGLASLAYLPTSQVQPTHNPFNKLWVTMPASGKAARFIPRHIFQLFGLLKSDNLPNHIEAKNMYMWILKKSENSLSSTFSG